MLHAKDHDFEPEEASPARPGDLRMADHGVAIAHVADRARAELRRQAAALGGASPLLHYIDRPESGIEVTRAHPASLPQFITGRSTLLSSLFRDEVALRTARLGAERVTAKSLELHTVRGIDAVRLAVGLASWHVGAEKFTAPVLLRPLSLRRHHSDFELKLNGRFEVNPELVRFAHEHFGIDIDSDALAAQAYDDGVFKPQPVIDWLREALAPVATFSVKPRLLVSTFADVAERMSRDLQNLDHHVLDALAGHESALEALQPDLSAVRVIDADDRPPAADHLLLDADREQEAVLARVVAGESLIVHTMPGTGGTQTIINAVGELVRAGKRVLVVSARGSTLDGIRHRLQTVGLGGMAVSTRQVRRDLMRAISRNEKATEPEMAQLDDMLLKVRGLAQSYRAALKRVHDGPQATPIEAIKRLAAMTMALVPPSTTARLSRDSVRILRDTRADAAAALTLAAQLGEFRIGPNDSPWYGVSFNATDDARAAHALASRLKTTGVPKLIERGYELISRTHMRPFLTIDELGEYLRLLLGIRDSLDKFTPMVFERPLGDIINAYASRGASTTSGADRRRLKRVAREYLRPGVHVTDMHEALTRIQRQRVQWRELVDNAGIPDLPLGLADVHVEWQRVDSDLAQLDAALGRGSRLAAMELQRLVRTLNSLAEDTEAFENIVERAELRTTLAERGLEPLLTELSVRHVDADQVAAELEFAWWQSALEHMVRDDSALLGSTTSVVDSIERDFVMLDEAHASRSGALLAWDLAQQWRIGVVDEADEAAALKRVLTQPAPTPADVLEAAPTLARVIAPVWASSPYDVPTIPDSVQFDTVIFADAGAISLVEAAPAVRRARQVVAFGDPVLQRPSAFTIGAGSEGDAATDAASLFDELDTVVSTATLTRSYRAGGEDLAELVNDAFYGGKLVSLPWAGSYLGRGSLTVDLVEGGRGVPDPETGAVESPDAEVQRVVTLAVEHAIHRPSETLMVITASARHAERVRAAINAAFAGRSDVADFLTRTATESLAVLTLEQSVSESRDRVIFSLGYGLTRHGRVLSEFGDLSTPDGERLLTVGMTRARRAMTIVSCISPEPEDDRLQHGAHTFMSILRAISRRRQADTRQDAADPLSLVLARELRALGVTVDVNYHGVLPLVAQRGNRALAIYSDEHLLDGSVRETLRFRVHTLRRLGWHFIRVHAFDVYSDPALTASRIAAVLGVADDTPRVAQDTEPLPGF